MTRVVNIKRESADVYIGRGTPFGNPFHAGVHGSREEVIELFRKHFRVKLKDPTFCALVIALEGKRLGCSCAPKSCHGDVIKEFIETGKV